MKKVLLITNIRDETISPQRRALQEFSGAVNSRQSDVEVSYCAVQELLFILQDGKLSLQWHGQELHASFDMVHLRNTGSYPYYANALRLYAVQHGMRYINEGDAAFPYMGKVDQGFLFAVHDIPTPDFVSSPRNAELLDYLLERTPYGYPFILKHSMGVRGLHNHLIRDAGQLTAVLRSDKHGFVAQPYVRNSGELRILTFGPDMDPLVFKKTAPAGSHLNNTAQGSDIKVIRVGETNPELIETSRRIAALCGRAITGIDILLAEDGGWYVLEANNTPSLATGVLADEKIERYIEFIKRYTQGTTE